MQANEGTAQHIKRQGQIDLQSTLSPPGKYPACSTFLRKRRT